MRLVFAKIFVMRFYQLNAGFFLLAFMLLFGIINGKDAIMLHYGIMQAIMGSGVFFSVAVLIWLLYAVKCVSFFFGVMKEPAGSFLYEIQAQPGSKQFQVFFLCFTATWLPVLVYGCTASVVGFFEGRILLPILFLVFQLAVCAAGAYLYAQRLNNSWKPPLITFPAIKIFRKKPFLSYLIHYSVHNRKGTFLTVKLCSLLLLQAMVAANTAKTSAEAVCVLIMFVISAHALLPLYYVRFAEQELAFMRNLPLRLACRYALFGVTYAVIFLPELLFLLLNTRHVMPRSVTLSLYALAVSQLSLYTGILYLDKMTTERYTMIVAALFFILLLLLASFNLWLLFLAQCLIAAVLFAKFFYRYEA